nr:(2Fe-2S)-binding protein [uncultured Sphingomonas sp.]
MIDDPLEISRRSLLSGSAVAASAATVLHAAPAEAQPQNAAAQDKPRLREISLTVNGVAKQLAVDTRTSLADLLRDKLGLRGTKVGCDMGQCGACTVHIDGKRELSCLTPAVAVDGHRVTTIEGLAGKDGLHPMQQAFIDNDAFQCGYCTPGQIMSAVACVEEGHARSDGEIREYMSGNLCRCAAYPNIVAAINQAKATMGRG